MIEEIDDIRIQPTVARCKGAYSENALTRNGRLYCWHLPLTKATGRRRIEGWVSTCCSLPLFVSQLLLCFEVLFGSFPCSRSATYLLV